MFPVATFTHRNFPVADPSLTSVQLDFVLDFLVNGVQTGPLTFTFTFNHEETPNNQDPCPYPTDPGEGCTDRVTFIDAPDPTTFTVGGKTYTLTMTFLDEDGNPVTEFITDEGGAGNTADLDGAVYVGAAGARGHEVGPGDDDRRTVGHLRHRRPEHRTQRRLERDHP